MIFNKYILDKLKFIMKNIAFIFVFIFSFCVSLMGQTLSDDELKILRIQDERDSTKYEQLIKFIRQDDTKNSYRALIAAGNIQDASLVKEVGDALLKSKNIDSRKGAAFALSEIGNAESIEYLMLALESEKDISAICSILDAIGKCGTQDNLNKILEKDFLDTKSKRYEALSIARFAIRGLKNTTCIYKLNELLSTNDDTLQMYIAYAFSRIRDRELLTAAKSSLDKLISSQLPYSRMWAYYAMAYAGNENDLKILVKNFDAEDNLQVKIAMLSSLSVYKNNYEQILNGLLLDLLTKSFNAQDLYIRLIALEQAGNLGSVYQNESKVANYLTDALALCFKPTSTIDWTEQGIAIQSYAKILKGESEEILLEKYSKTDNYALKPDIIRALKYTKNDKVVYSLRNAISSDVQNYTKRHNLSSSDIVQDDTLASIYRAFIETLDNYRETKTDSIKTFLRLIFSEFLGSKDAPIVDMCINALNSPAFKDFQGETEIVMSFDVNELAMPKDKEVLKLFIKEFSYLKASSAIPILEKLAIIDDFEISNLAIDAIKNISGKEITITAKRKFFNDYENLKFKYATIHTNKGDIKIRLYTDIAPMTCLNFIRLAKSNFYQNTFFHRVIPNFVIQGGDPLNTGWGGTDYSIRSEFSPLHFTEGILGMASDGKDTEGSQFFIMHIPHFHLDGKYTAFGEVIDGMEVVNNIYINVHIISVVPEEN